MLLNFGGAVLEGGKLESQSTLSDYFAVLRRRKWVVVIVALVSLGAAVIVASRQQHLYAATATILLNPDSSLVNGAGQSAADAQARFASGEAAVAHTPRVASTAVRKVPNAKMTASQLVAKSSVKSDPDSNVLTFSVTSPSKDFSVRLVNAYAQSFATFTSRQSTARIAAAIASETAQIDRLTTRIAAVRKANESAAALYSQLRSLINQRSQDRASLTSVTAGGGAQVTRLATSAHLTQPDPKRDGGVALAVGLVLGVALAFIREAFDNRVQTADEIGDALSGMSILGRIPAPPRSVASKGELVMMARSIETDQEAFHKLRVALDFANLKPRCVTIMITSAVEEEGKSVTAANLAVAYAMTGRSVVLADLDPRRPAVQRYFPLGGRPGVTDVALGGASLEDAIVPVVVTHATGGTSAAGNGASADHVLRVIGAGTFPPNPAVFFETAEFLDVLRQIREMADCVVIDCAPLLPVADSLVLSRQVDGLVVVTRLGVVTRSALGELRRTLTSLTIDKLGVVITGGDAHPGYGYGYGGPGETSYKDSTEARGASSSERTRG